MYGFTGIILLIDLTFKTSVKIIKQESFYQKYLGGSFLAAKLLDDLLPKKNRNTLSAYSNDNMIVFATGLMAGSSICGTTRVNVLTISPETKGIFLSQAGGEFGPEMKRAGYDAIIIKGKASSPVYIKLTTANNSQLIEFVDAKKIWGKDCVCTNDTLNHDLNNELKDKYVTASIGPAGENRVACANIMFENGHYAGRGGIGAVMGDKNLKAISIKGDKKPLFKDKAKVFEINKLGAKNFKDQSSGSFLDTLNKCGTFGLLAANQEAGNLPTHNFKDAFIDNDEYTKHISHSNIKSEYVGKLEPCKGCFIACKKKYKKDTKYENWTSLAEYESIAMLGPNIGLEKDMHQGLKACEICNRFGLDTISVGNMIGWIMDCFENNLIEESAFDFSIKFGEGKKACDLIEAIAFRKNELANLLADGVKKAVEKLGEKTQKYLRASCGIGFPAHMPRRKPGIGFGYLHGPNPSDHMKFEHDWIATDPDMIKAFKLDVKPSDPEALDKSKVEVLRKTQIYYSAMDILSTCMFVFGPGNIYSFENIVDMVNAATGLDITFDDLMEAGKRSVYLQRKLYTQLGGLDESFLSYFEDEISNGPSKGYKINEFDFNEARQYYYKLWNWDKS